MNRTFSGFLIGLPITFILFLFMSLLIETKADPQVYTHLEPPVIDKVMREQEITPTVHPDLPEPDPIHEQPSDPEVPTEVIDENEPLINLEDPIDFPAPPGTIPHNNIPGGHQPGNNNLNQDAMPILISEPRWPREATTGGSVRLCFTIMPDGRPANIVVVNSEPSRVFVKTAKRAVYNWKFKPSFVDGHAIEQSDMCYTMEFKLEE